MEIQVWISQMVAGLAGMLQVGYAFGAGMVSAVNPCGFAMLPVYLSLYLGADEQSYQQLSPLRRLLRATGVAGVVTAGYGTLFGLIGVVVSLGGSFIMPLMPWISIIIGAALIVLGLWMLLGRHVSIDIFMRIGSQIGDPRTISVTGFFLFGLAYGATSLSCTLPIFLVVVGGSLTSGDFISSLLQFFSYVIGTGSILLMLTVAMALVKGGLVLDLMKRAVPHVHTISAVMLLLAGFYICYYWLTSGLLLP
jgi:cytochrome c biogenesis protein CcdA